MDKNPQYFEGVLQLREPTGEVIDFVNSHIREKKGVWIAKKAVVRNGIDYFLSSQHFLQSIGKRLQKRFPGTLKVSRKLHTRNKQSSKDLYRITVMFRPSKLRTGQVVRVNDEKIKIKGFGKKISGISLETGRKVMFDEGDIK